MGNQLYGPTLQSYILQLLVCDAEGFLLNRAVVGGEEVAGRAGLERGNGTYARIGERERRKMGKGWKGKNR